MEPTKRRPDFILNAKSVETGATVRNIGAAWWNDEAKTTIGIRLQPFTVLDATHFPVHMILTPNDKGLLSWEEASAALADLEAAREDAKRVEQVMAECYQAVGTFGEALGIDEDDSYIRLLDTLAFHKASDGKPLLPFPTPVNSRAEKAEAKINELQAAIEKNELTIEGLLERLPSDGDNG